MDVFWSGLGIGLLLGLPIFCLWAGLALVTWAEGNKKND
jgi:hypothetical protein